nr:MAG TPA: hypothetical protein [Microviridae sp.]
MKLEVSTGNFPSVRSLSLSKTRKAGTSINYNRAW